MKQDKEGIKIMTRRTQGHFEKAHVNSIFSITFWSLHLNRTLKKFEKSTPTALNYHSSKENTKTRVLKNSNIFLIHDNPNFYLLMFKYHVHHQH
jgi:hypothetical protein